MAEITASMVKELREKTDAPMMECKKALTEAAGDMGKAEEILRVKLERVKRLLNAEVIDMKPLGMDLDEELGITDADFSEVLSEADAAAEGRDPEEEDE